MNVTLDQIYNHSMMYAEAVLQSYFRSIEPDSDYINQSEAKTYLRRKGFEVSALKKWTDAGLITAVKRGNNRTSRVFYSFAKLKHLLASLQLKEMCNNQMEPTS